jgi:hypothetical protein
VLRPAILLHVQQARRRPLQRPCANALDKALASIDPAPYLHATTKELIS